MLQECRTGDVPVCVYSYLEVRASRYGNLSDTVQAVDLCGHIELLSHTVFVIDNSSLIRGSIEPLDRAQIPLVVGRPEYLAALFHASK